MMHTFIQREKYLLMHKIERHLLIQYHEQRDTITSIVIPNGYHSKIKKRDIQYHDLLIQRDTEAIKKRQWKQAQY